MKINIDKLKLQVADPDWPERLLPLFMFRGATRPSRIHTLWNVAYAMYLGEVESYGDAVKTFNTPRPYFNAKKGRTYTHFDGPPNEVGHLCGMHAGLQHSGLRGIFERLRSQGGIQLTDSVDKGFTDYVEWMNPGPCILIPVAQHSDLTDPRKIAWWRVAREKMKRGRKPSGIVKVKGPAWYMKDAPSMVSARPNVSADATLMQHIHALVPKGFPAEVRGDLCQDLMVAVLSGEHKVGELPTLMEKFSRNARKFMPDRFKHISLDDRIPGTDDLRYVDTLHSCESDFAPRLEHAIDAAEQTVDVPAAMWKHVDLVAPEGEKRRVIQTYPRADRMVLKR